ncbi:MAG: Holliday junction resolvase RuvX [Candidatus Acidiferrales bacterium]
MAGRSRASARGIRADAAPETNTARILAIDYGRKRIGLAISDELGLTARPLVTFVRKNRRADLHRLRDICRQHGIVRILVGHPLHISGLAGEMADEAAQFAGRLKKELGIVVELVDERLTTWEAEQTMAEMKSSSRRRRTPMDDVAAAVLLREYLNCRRSPSRPARAEQE